MDKLHDWVAWLHGFDYKPLITVLESIAILALIFAILYGIGWLSRKFFSIAWRSVQKVRRTWGEQKAKRERIEKMRHRARTEYEKRLVTDLITHAFEEAENQGLWTRRSKQTWYTRFAKTNDLPDLLPKRLIDAPAKIEHEINKLKTAIKDRLASSNHLKVNIPEPKKDNVVPLPTKDKSLEGARAALGRLSRKSK